MFFCFVSFASFAVLFSLLLSEFLFSFTRCFVHIRFSPFCLMHRLYFLSSFSPLFISSSARHIRFLVVAWFAYSRLTIRYIFKPNKFERNTKSCMDYFFSWTFVFLSIRLHQTSRRLHIQSVTAIVVVAWVLCFQVRSSALLYFFSLISQFASSLSAFYCIALWVFTVPLDVFFSRVYRFLCVTAQILAVYTTTSTTCV